MPTTDMMIEAFIQHQKDPLAAPIHHFWQLVDRFRADLINQGYAILGNLQDAEDVAQETLCRAYRELHQLNDPTKLGAWIRSINRCNALDLRRRRKRECNARHEIQEQGSDPATGGFTQVDVKELIARAVDSLPEDLRTVVVFRYWEHLPYQEIARRLNMPLGTVKSQLARADRLLERRLQVVLAPGQKPAAPSEPQDAEDAPEEEGDA
ncbi:MAG: RNA polymerase sigma factor [Planctomycetota bacterium]|nr:RNA polymerase sigma factor [Planctomycetota bacterium]